MNEQTINPPSKEPTPKAKRVGSTVAQRTAAKNRLRGVKTIVIKRQLTE